MSVVVAGANRDAVAWHRSVRAKLVLVFTLVLLAPQLIVVVWLGIENTCRP